jgi:hypothetical protein
MSRLFGGIIELNSVGEPIPPELILAYRSGSKQGVISNAVSISVGNHMADADEISFDVHKYMDGMECPLWSDIKDFKLVYVPQFETDNFNPWYELEVTVDETDETVKHCEGVHLQEAELSQLTLNNIEINTETDIARDDYVVTVLYNPDKPEGSLLNRILNDKASHYEIYHVDSSLVNMQRTFSWDGNTIKDAFDDIAEELECIFVYGEGSADGKLHRTISVYDLNDVCLDCGERGAFSNKVCTKCGSSTIKYGYGTDTGIFISHENFASSIDYSSNKDEVKNCFRLVAGDDLMTATVRNINPNGSQYIWYISDDTRNEMSPTLRSKLEEYDAKYEAYSTTEDMNISESTVNSYNSLVNKYKSYDSSLTTITYPVKGYSALTDFYYQALNLYSLLYTSLAPASAAGKPTTAEEEIKKLTSDTLSPLGLQNASTASATTVSLAVANYARVYIDTSLYKLTATTSSYSNMIWKGTITLESYTDEEDTATTSELSITITDATADFIKCQIEKAMKKNDTDATGTVALFKMSEADFKTQLGYYSVSNLNILASIARGCLDVMIEQGVADNTVSGYADLYNELYLPYYNKSGWIQNELKERESEVARVRGSKDTPTGALDYIEKERQAIANILDLRSYLGETLWAEFSSFRRDDEYHNENFISDGLTDTELISHAKEFYKYAQREIVKSATLQHTISCNLNDLLLVREQDVYSVADISAEGNVSIVTHDGRFLIRNDNEFSPLLTNFDTGNWIRVEVDEKVYKLRMTDYQIDYDDLSDIDVDFSDVIYGLGYMSDTQDILSKASSMATSYSATVKQASKGNSANQQITNMVENGLSLTNSKIVNAASNQNLVVDESGMLMREKNEYGNDYSNEQIKIINHGFYYTSDNWATVKTGMGKFIYYDPESGTYKEDYGLIARKIVGNIILGNEVGIYNTSGSVKMDEDGFTITSDADDVNKKLFTLRRQNKDGSYTNYIYVDDDGNIRFNGNSIIMSTGDNLDSYFTVGARNILKFSNKATGCHVYGSNAYTVEDSEMDGKHVTAVTRGSSSGAIYYEIYADNLLGCETNEKLAVSMHIYSGKAQTLNMTLSRADGYLPLTDMQSVTLESGWNTVYTVLTIENLYAFMITDSNKEITADSGASIISDISMSETTLRITDSLSASDSYNIDYIQLEKGNRPTDFYPAPEDIYTYFDDTVATSSDELRSLIADVISDVDANSDELNALTKENGVIDEIRRSNVATQQNVDSLETNVNTYIVQVDSLNNRIVGVEQTTECFSLEDAGLRITRKVSSQEASEQFSMLLSEQKLSFYQGTKEVAYFSNNKLHVTDAEILDKLQLGKFAFIPRTNGNLSFRYIG